MTTDGSPSVSVEFTPEFKRNLRQLARKYRRIKADVQPLLDSLEQGQTPGDQIPNVQYEVFKVRLSNSDSAKGKSGGYRIVYHRRTDGPVVLITIYSKTEQQDITPNDIRAIIVGYDNLVIEPEPELAGVPPEITSENDTNLTDIQGDPDLHV